MTGSESISSACASGPGGAEFAQAWSGKAAFEKIMASTSMGRALNECSGVGDRDRVELDEVEDEQPAVLLLEVEQPEALLLDPPVEAGLGKEDPSSSSLTASLKRGGKALCNSNDQQESTINLQLSTHFCTREKRETAQTCRTVSEITHH